MGAASSLAPSYDLAFKNTRAAPSSLPPSARPPRTARERANGPAFPPMQRVRTSSRRASSTPIARKRAPRMTPPNEQRPLGRRLGEGVFYAPVERRPARRPSGRRLERRRPRRRLGGGVLCAPVGAACFRRRTPEQHRSDHPPGPPTINTAATRPRHSSRWT